MKSEMIEALELCQKALSMMITPAQIDQTSTLQAFALATEAEAKARSALSVQPAAAVVGEPVAYASSKEWRKNHLMSAAQYKSALPKNAVDFDIPLYATLPDEALAQSEQATFDIAARLLKERDALASLLSQQDSELDRMRRELNRLEVSNQTVADELGNEIGRLQRELAEARAGAFREAAEIAGKLLTAEFTLQETGFMRGIGYAAQSIFDALRAKAEETRT